MNIEKYDTTILQSKTCANIVVTIKSLLRMVGKSDVKRTVTDKEVLKVSRNIVRKQRQASDRMKSIHEKHHQAQLKRDRSRLLKENDKVEKS
tara:strand:+ start:330 stop:605 length:276 start_codon:yes stop_codon:yes gene_type:complete